MLNALFQPIRKLQRKNPSNRRRVAHGFQKSCGLMGGARRSFSGFDALVGDSLVGPSLLEKVDYAFNHARIKNVLLTTSAILLNRNETHKWLINLGIGGVCISTPGASKGAYEKV